MNEKDRKKENQMTKEKIQAYEAWLHNFKGKPEWGDVICEPLAAYLSGKKQGEYTVEDIENIPEEYRVEIIDGVIFEMEAPWAIHQTIGLELAVRLREYIRKSGGKCVPFVAPVDVQLDCDDKTMVQPDVVVLCDRKKNNGKRIIGAPDFVAEILSKSARQNNMDLKFAKYLKAGVREYWLIDPDRKSILVYDFGGKEFPALYGFDDVIPVRIFGGECKVDFREIHAYLKEIYGE